MNGMSAPVKPHAVAAWALLAVIGLIDWAWMGWAGFHLGPGFVRYISFAFLLGLIGLFYFITGRDDRLPNFALFLVQYELLFGVLIPFSYLAVSIRAPLVDRAFDALDKAMGLNWINWTEWVVAHPIVHWSFGIVYASLPTQILFCCFYNAHARAYWRNMEIWWITFISALVTIGIGALAPGISAWVYYGFADMHDFPHMWQFEMIRGGTMRVITFGDVQGFVQLPSFHTILAIMLTYNLRHNRWLFAAALALNTAVILSCPTEGGHYFIDIIAGGTVAAVTIWRLRSFSAVSPELPRFRSLRPNEPAASIR